MTDLLQQAIAVIKAGDKDNGRRLLRQVLQTDRRNETAWVWLSSIVSSDEERRFCLQQVLAINPDNEQAKRGLVAMRPERSPPVDEAAQLVAPSPLETLPPTPPQQSVAPASEMPSPPDKSLKDFRRKLKKYYNILKEREAKYAGRAPLDLLNQIEDYETAIALTEAALIGDLTPAELDEALRPLILEIDPGPGQPDYSPPPEPTRPPELGQFVGRKKELNHYADQLKNKHLAVISGMAGVGKTALAITLAETWQVWQMSRPPAADRVVLDMVERLETAAQSKVFWHSFHEDEGVMAVVWQLAGFLAWHGQDEVWRMLQAARQKGGQPPPATALFDYVLKLIRGQGYLLCLDDVQHVRQDPHLIQFIDRLRELIQAGEVSLILTSREVPDYIRSAAIEPLQGLSAADVGRVVASQGVSLSDELVEALHTLTEGNAEIVTLAANVLKRANDLAGVIERLTEADDIERYLIKEVDDGLSGNDREVMIAVAMLLGYSGSREAIETISDRRRLKRVLRGLSDLHLLTAHQDDLGELYGEHAIIRAFYYDVPSRRERQAMHRLAANYYQTEEVDLLKAALHFERANEYQQAAELISADVWALINQGQAQPALNLLQRLERHPLDLALRVKVALALGQIYGYLGESQAARERYEAVLSQLAQQPETSDVRLQKARTYRGLGELMEQENPEEALHWLQQGLALVVGSNEFEEAVLYVDMGMVHMFLGHHLEALEALERGLARLPEEASQLRVTAMMGLGIVYYEQGDVARAVEITLQSLTMSQQLNDHFQTAELLNTLGTYKFDAGDWPGAVTDFRQALHIADRLGSDKIRAQSEGNLGVAHIYLGDDETALQHLTSGLNLAHQTSQRIYEAQFQLSKADLCIRRQAWPAAITELSEVERLARELELEMIWPAIYRGWAEIKQAGGQKQAALDDAEQSVILVQGSGEDFELGLSLRILGQMYLANDQRQPALAAFAHSLSLLENINPYEAARTKVQWGLALLSDQTTDQGLALLTSAESIFRKLGAERDLRILERGVNS